MYRNFDNDETLFYRLLTLKLRNRIDSRWHPKNTIISGLKIENKEKVNHKCFQVNLVD